MFPALVDATNIGFYTKDLVICNGQLAEIFVESWKDVIALVRELVIKDQSPRAVVQDSTDSATPTNRGIFCLSTI
jgi:hypothetical protein